MDYNQFLNSKQLRVESVGKKIDKSEINPKLFDFQKDIVHWAVHKGRCAVFADTGLGKTFMFLEWARLIGVRTLIIAPLSVAYQTINEGKKINITIKYVKSLKDLDDQHQIFITNYDNIEKFDASFFQAVVLDESSILKNLTGATKLKLTEMFKETPYKLCATATPAPNDIIELANHAEFLNIMTRAEMLSTFFTYNKAGGTSKADSYRLKKHGTKEFYRWLASWAMALKKPSDLGYDDAGYILPTLHTHLHLTDADYTPPGMLPGMGAFVKISAIDAKKIRRQTIADRQGLIVDMVNNGEKWVIWCDLNDESDALSEVIPDSINVHGTMDAEEKARLIYDFVHGDTRVLITKMSIAGMGINMQSCHNMIFFGINYSWEGYYQAVRRVWRFGQESEVYVHVVTSKQEESIYQSILKKEKEAVKMTEQLIKASRIYSMEELKENYHREWKYSTAQQEGSNYTLLLGDSCLRMSELEDNSVDFIVYSPPFGDIFVYSATPMDIGNSTDEQFLMHYGIIVKECLRVLKPGRLCAVHIADARAFKGTDGYTGRKDLSGDIIELHVQTGWHWKQRITVDKNPQALKNGSLVLTPSGWLPIDLLVTGDQVIGGDGKPTDVLGVYPHDKRTMYRVTFSDKTSIDCDANHLWTTRRHGKKYSPYQGQPEWQTMRTDELFGNLHSPSGKLRYEIPIVKPIEFDRNIQLPIDPYLLGVIIGDGNISERATVCLTVEPEIISNLSLPDGCYAREQPNTEKGNGVRNYHIQHKDWHVNPVLDALREIGLQGKRAWEKRIPVEYLFASIDERVALLRGLMDTDGTCKNSKTALYATTSKELADDIVFLVRSLGGLTKVAIENPTYTYKGEKKQGRTRYVVTVRTNQNPFNLERKAQRWSRSRELQRRIISIETVEESHCTCITVANPDGLFVTENFIVTHNSQAIRLKDHGLLFKTLEKDSADLTGGHPDYVLIFRKPGDNAVPIKPLENGEMSNEDWIRDAHPVWYDINETDVLNVREARSEDDEKHMCPLQLPLIARLLKLWSNPKEVVFSPFAGIGSELHEAIRLGRYGVGIELKPEYYHTAIKNLENAEKLRGGKTLFDWAQEQQQIAGD